MYGLDRSVRRGLGIDEPDWVMIGTMISGDGLKGRQGSHV